VDTESRRADVATEQAQEVLKRLRKESKIACPAVGVVLNRVSRARMVFERLKTELKEEADLLLIIACCSVRTFRTSSARNHIKRIRPSDFVQATIRTSPIMRRSF
jgi:CRISPR-associated endonuclease/helicase Cas3